MRKITLLFLIFTIQTFAQEEEKKSENFVKFDILLRIHAIYSFQIGDYSLAKSHTSYPGIGVSLSLIDIQNFKIGAGYNLEIYNVSDHEKIGNFNASNYSSVFGTLNYEIKVFDKVSVYPNVGIGAAILHQKSGFDSYGYQNGIEYRAGLISDYKISKNVSFFFGVNYIYSKLNMDTNPEFKDYFSNAKKFQLSLGLQID
jgi:hypothetical protein